jgi:tRNA (mo5U34)-methyltransferase
LRKLKYSKAKCIARLEETKSLDWYHKFEIVLGSGIETPGRLDVKGYEWRRNFVGLTEDFLRGKRVLDIGAYSGAFSFILEDLGAEVVAADVYDPDLNGFNVVHDLRGSNVKHARMSVYDLDPEEIGLFDIVAFYGVFYHLKHPVLAFERCNSVLKDGGLFIGGGTGLDRWFHDSDPSCLEGANLDFITKEMVNNPKIMSVDNLNQLRLCGFAPDQFLKDKSNWFIPNLQCLLAWVEAAGFDVTGSHRNAMPIDRSWNADKRVFRSSLNFKAVKTGEPRLEYSIPPMKRFRIPTSYEVDTLKARIAELEAEVSQLKST